MAVADDRSGTVFPERLDTSPFKSVPLIWKNHAIEIIKATQFLHRVIIQFCMEIKECLAGMVTSARPMP